MDEAYLDLPNMTKTLHNDDLTSTVQTIKYSLVVLVYLCFRDVIKYAIPLIKAYIADKLKTT
jgi:hypothetical protein